MVRGLPLAILIVLVVVLALMLMTESCADAFVVRAAKTPRCQRGGKSSIPQNLCCRPQGGMAARLHGFHPQIPHDSPHNEPLIPAVSLFPDLLCFSSTTE